MSDSFSRNLAISGIGHLVIVLLIFFRAVMAPNEPIQIRNAIRVDVVGLPPKMQTLPENPPALAPKAPPAPAELPKKAEPQVVKKAPVESTVKLTKSTNDKTVQKALNKLKALEALEKIKQEVGKEKVAKAKPADVVLGNKVNAGNALTGLEKLDYDRYFDEMETKVRSNWNIPQWLADREFSAQVQVLIDERGYVIKKVLRKSSNNEIFDAKVMEAIDASSPLPAPPQRLRGVLSTSGVMLNFP